MSGPFVFQGRVVVVAAEVVGQRTTVVESAARVRVNWNGNSAFYLDRRTRVCWVGDRHGGQERSRIWMARILEHFFGLAHLDNLQIHEAIRAQYLGQQ